MMVVGGTILVFPRFYKKGGFLLTAQLYALAGKTWSVSPRCLKRFQGRDLGLIIVKLAIHKSRVPTDNQNILKDSYP